MRDGLQILGLQLGNGTVISYTAAPNGTTYNLFRNVCAAAGPPPLQTRSWSADDLPLVRVPSSTRR